MDEITILTLVAVLGMGATLALIGVLLGAFIMYRGKVTPGTGEGFLKDPKGAVFTVPDNRMVDEPSFPGSSEPGPDEQRILKQTKRFLKVMGGETK